MACVDVAGGDAAVHVVALGPGRPGPARVRPGLWPGPGPGPARALARARHGVFGLAFGMCLPNALARGFRIGIWNVPSEFAWWVGRWGGMWGVPVPRTELT